eukprot:s94_g74.t1
MGGGKVLAAFHHISCIIWTVRRGFFFSNALAKIVKSHAAQSAQRISLKWTHLKCIWLICRISKSTAYLPVFYDQASDQVKLNFAFLVNNIEQL